MKITYVLNIALIKKIGGRKSLNLLTSFVVFLIFSTSCSKKEDTHYAVAELNFGVSKYYPKFLFVKEKNEVLEKKIKFKYNEWAIDEGGYANIVFYDNESKIIDSNYSNINLEVNGEKIESGFYQLQSSQAHSGELEIKLNFQANTKSQTLKGYVMIENSNLDRVNHTENLTQDAVMTWSAKQTVLMNPLKKWISIILIVLVLALLVWIILLRPIAFPRFKKKSSIIITSPFYKRIKLKGGIKLTLMKNNPKAQKISDKVLKGKILIYKHQFFDEDIHILPAGKNKIRIALGVNYSISPFASTIQRGPALYVITNNTTKEEIKIQYN